MSQELVNMMTATVWDLQDVWINVNVLTLVMSLDLAVMDLESPGQNPAKMNVKSRDQDLAKEDVDKDMENAGSLVHLLQT